MKTREEVHAEFGTPGTNGIEDGVSFDTYRSRRKISDPTRAHGNGLGIAYTYGVTELVIFPYEVIHLFFHSTIGQKLRFKFDENGKVVDVLLDGNLSNYKSSDEYISHDEPDARDEYNFRDPNDVFKK